MESSYIFFFSNKKGYLKQMVNVALLLKKFKVCQEKTKQEAYLKKND